MWKEFRKNFLTNAVLTCLAISAITFYNSGTPDPYCDPDPLYGGCSNSGSGFENFSVGKWLGRSVGLYIFGNLFVMAVKPEQAMKMNPDIFREAKKRDWPPSS